MRVVKTEDTASVHILDSRSRSCSPAGSDGEGAGDKVDTGEVNSSSKVEVLESGEDVLSQQELVPMMETASS